MKIYKIFLFSILLSTLTSQAFATVSFSVKNEEIPKTKILFFGFDYADPRLKSDAFEILERIRKNLKTTDLFEIVKQSGHMEIVMPNHVINGSLNENLVQQNLTVESIPNFEKYEKTGIGAIVIGQFNYDQTGNLEVRIRMWDVLDQRQLFGKFYTSSKDNYRKMANIISNEIFKVISGEKVGHFTSQILYASESGSAGKRIKKINLMDFDGENRRVLTDGRELVLTPIFSKKPDEIFYLRYFENRPQIFALDLKNLRSKKIGGFRGTTFAASINPRDQNLVLISAISDGNSDIYELNIATNVARRLTKSPSIDTTASYSPDGKSIAFSSDRDSGQQIYLMDEMGSSVKKISVGVGSYSKPVWSPDGKLIAFTKIKGGQFFIGVMTPNGNGEKLLVSAYSAEGAKWSPNGRYLIYSKKKGSYGQDSIPRLYIIDIITGFEFEVPTPTNEGATDPDWA
jgi:TolB protein